MGQCLYSPALELLVLDLQWLGDVFKGLITPEEQRHGGDGRGRHVRNGIVLPESLTSVWPNATPNDIVQYMGLLEKFHIAFRKLDGSYVIPCLLPAKRTSVALSLAGALRPTERVYAFRRLRQRD